MDYILSSCLLSSRIYNESLVLVPEDSKSLRVIKNDDVGTYCCVYVDNVSRVYYIVFRGSEFGIKDWLTNFLFRQMVVPAEYYEDGNKLSDVRVHRGFIRAYVSIRDILLRYLVDLNKDYKYVFTGHSLGGALAMLAGMDYGYQVRYGLRGFNGYKQGICVTYGAPACGNREFVNTVNDLLDVYIRYENRGDIVVKLPSFIFGYRHKDEIRIKFGDDYLGGHSSKNYVYNVMESLAKQ